MEGQWALVTLRWRNVPQLRNSLGGAGLGLDVSRRSPGPIRERLLTQTRVEDGSTEGGGPDGKGEPELPHPTSERGAAAGCDEEGSPPSNSVDL